MSLPRGSDGGGSIGGSEPDIAQWVREDFCHSFCYRVTDPQLRDAFSATVNDLYGVAVTANQQGSSRQHLRHGGTSRESPRGPRAVAEEPRFPGSVPCSIMRSDLDLLRTRHYVAFEKTDGTRYLLLCTMVNDVSFCVLIDRHWTARIIRLQFEPDVFERNTMFDGELVQNLHTNQWHFLIFDLVSSGELSTRQQNYVLRMNAANHIIRSEFRPDSSRDAFLLQVKRYEKMEDIERLRHADKEYKGFSTDGYLFMPVNNYVAPFRNRAILKWKSKHTIDFELRYRSGIGLEYYLKDEHDVPKYFGPVPPPTAPTAPTQHRQVLTECLERIRAGERVIVECDYDSAESMWFVIKERVDRQGANAEYTVERTLDNLRENITKEELFHVINNERVARRPPSNDSSSRGSDSRFDRRDYHNNNAQPREQQRQQQWQQQRGEQQQQQQQWQQQQAPQQQQWQQPQQQQQAPVEHWKQQPYYVNYCAPGTSFPMPPTVFSRQRQPPMLQSDERQRYSRSEHRHHDTPATKAPSEFVADVVAEAKRNNFYSPTVVSDIADRWESAIASADETNGFYSAQYNPKVLQQTQPLSSYPLDASSSQTSCIPLFNEKQKKESDFFAEDPSMTHADSLDYAAPPAHFLPSNAYGGGTDEEKERESKKRKTTAMEYDPLRPGYDGERPNGAQNKNEIFRPILVEDNAVARSASSDQPLDLQAALEQLSSVLKANPNGLLAQTIMSKK